ncbi:MAG: tetratricopeptide repeat protein [Oligoflexia bacterium]|nr:tetratricopeptide repeat protein [Oligoflexia bacterium]
MMKKQSFDVLFFSMMVLAVVSVMTSGCSPKQAAVAPGAGVQSKASDPVAIAAQAFDHNPTFENAINFGLALHSVGNHQKAMEIYQTVTINFPRASLGFNNLCAEYNDLQKYPEAVEACKHALELQPNLDLAKNNLAFAQSRVQMQNARIDQLREEAAHGKNRDSAAIDLGLELYQRGSYDQAIEAWQRVSAKSQFYAKSMNNIASAYIVLKKYDLAKQALDQALKLDPSNALYRNNAQWLSTASGGKVTASTPSGG